MVGVMDTTLKFALSALWNLTDEVPIAARNFIECQGLELYEEVLEVEKYKSYIDLHSVTHSLSVFVSQSYYSEPSIQQKVLGLMVC